MAEGRYSYDKYAEALRKEEGQVVPDAVKVIRTTVKLVGPRAVQEEITALSPEPTDRGGYKRSFRFEDIEGGATAYNFSPYASVLEKGRRPGAKAPPLAVIMDWVIRKKIGGASRSGAGLTKARGLAYVIARAIKRRGLPALLILEGASKTIDAEVRRGLDEMLARRT